MKTAKKYFYWPFKSSKVTNKIQAKMRIQSNNQLCNKTPKFTSKLSSKIARAEIDKLKKTLDVIEKHKKDGNVDLLAAMGIFPVALWATFWAMEAANKK